jgi:hypothetical protein
VSERDYLIFRDDILVAIADDQEPPGLVEVDLFEVCQRRNIRFIESWVHLVGKDLEELGFGKDKSTLKNRRFLLNGAGLAKATEIRRARKPKPVLKRVNEANWTMWGVVVAALALIAYVVFELRKP